MTLFAKDLIIATPPAHDATAPDRVCTFLDGTIQTLTLTELAELSSTGEVTI